MNTNFKVNKAVTKLLLINYGFRYKDSGDYKLYIPVYKYNDITTTYAYFYINLEDMTFTYDIRNNGTTYYPFYDKSISSKVNTIIKENIENEINKMIKKGILKVQK